MPLKGFGSIWRPLKRPGRAREVCKKKEKERKKVDTIFCFLFFLFLCFAPPLGPPQPPKGLSLPSPINSIHILKEQARKQPLLATK